MATVTATRIRAVVCRSAALGLLLLLLLLSGMFGWSVPQAAARVAAATIGADAPIQLDRTGQITDQVGALGDRRDQVATALNQLDSQRGIQLFVAYVRDFSGKAPADWANETATKNGLGLHDVLLAVATHARQYGYSTDTDSGVTSAQLASVATAAIEPALRQNDWAGAAIGAADGINAVMVGQPVPAVAITPGHPDPGASSSSSSSDAGWIGGTVVVVGAVGVGAYAYSRSRRRPTAAGGPGGQVPLKELDASAKHALVATDDAVRTSEEELGFASAEFGDEAAAPFAEALAEAKAELMAAFRLRQALDDEIPEDEPTQRRMLAEIIERCRRANTRLDAEAKSFDRLRALVEHAPAALSAATEAASAQTARVSAAAAHLQQLRTTYADSATAPVVGHPQQIADRLAFANESLSAARTSLDGNDRRRAAVLIRGAEAGVEQAGLLLDAIDRRSAELDAAAAKLPAALAEMDSDLADAHGLSASQGAAAASADLAGRAARARQVLTTLRQEMAGRYDPIDALRRAEEADALLDEALDAVREREQNDRRARSLLEQATLTARSEIAAAEDFVATRRGAVGSQARTRLAEAKRLLQQSAAAAGSDPSQALALAQQADGRARQAMAAAQGDADRYRSPYGGQSGSMGGAVLGGIILGDLLGGGRGGRGGRGGGGFGGGGGGGFGGAGPGSFGGGGTRGRLGGGGRF
ncbi:putative membrane protein YgcG [Catenulispora sp. EB89]|uniref:TPM domain-containing protein n=1 Tax=Catenulispora sp. EB89 TaxID=3156257 RepID=UPI003514F9AA